MHCDIITAVDSDMPTNETNREQEIETTQDDSASKSENESTEPTCAICLQPLTHRAYLNQCFHSFCLECIKSWTQHSGDCPLCKTPATFVIYDVDEAASTFKRLYFDQGSFNYERSVVRAEEVRRQRQRDRRRHKSRRRIPAAPSSKPVNMDLPASLQGPFVYIDPTCHMPIPRPSSQLPYDPSSPTSKILYRQNVYTNDLTSTPLPISPYYRHVDYLMPNHLPRAIPFIQRDLQALLRDDYDDMILHHVQEAFLIPYHQHLQHPTQAIIRALAGWFGEEDQTSPKITSRFVSEVLDFVKSGLSMAQYDQQKKYGS